MVRSGCGFELLIWQINSDTDVDPQKLRINWYKIYFSNKNYLAIIANVHSVPVLCKESEMVMYSMFILFGYNLVVKCFAGLCGNSSVFIAKTPTDSLELFFSCIGFRWFMR